MIASSLLSIQSLAMNCGEKQVTHDTQDGKNITRSLQEGHAAFLNDLLIPDEKMKDFSAQSLHINLSRIIPRLHRIESSIIRGQRPTTTDKRKPPTVKQPSTANRQTTVILLPSGGQIG
jgi:hypothetical protein